MRGVFAVLSCWIAASASAEQIDCTYDQECFADEECADTNFSLTLEYDPPSQSITLAGGDVVERFAARLITDAETLEGSYMVPPEGDPEGTIFGGANDVASVLHQLSILPDGMSEYTANFHLDDFAILYLGRCEGFPE